MKIAQVGMAMAALVFVMGPAVEHTQVAGSERCPDGALCLFDEEERMTANIEYAPPDVLREAQNAGLRQMIERAMRVEFYRQRLASHGIDSATLTVDDLPRLPCTYKEDLRSHYPYGL